MVDRGGAIPRGRPAAGCGRLGQRPWRGGDQPAPHEVGHQARGGLVAGAEQCLHVADHLVVAEHGAVGANECAHAGQRVVEAIGVASAPGDLVSDVGEEVLRRRGQASTGHGGFGVAALGLDEGVDHGPVVLWETEHVGDRVARDGRGPLRSDFRQLAFLHGPPPKAIWLRVGNVTTNDIHRLLADSYDTIEHFYADEDEALLVLDIR